MDYKKIYNKLMNKRRKCPITQGYKEKHHVMPRSLGGDNSKQNIVTLTAKEHYVAHLLLTKMYNKYSEEWYKMIRAFMMMSACKSEWHENKRYTGRIHEVYRSRFSEAMSELQSGTKNSNYGKKWVYSITEKRNKTVDKDYILEEGWYIGRLMSFENINSTQDIHENRRRKCKHRYSITKNREYRVLRAKNKDEAVYDMKKNEILNVYNGFINSGMKISKYAKEVGICVKKLSLDFLLYIDDYHNNTRKSISNYDDRMEDTIQLYKMYIDGGYKSVREFRRSENIKLTSQAICVRFREFIPEYVTNNK